MSNSIIQEIRNIREQYAASMNYDLDRIFDDLKQRQKQHAADGWIVSPPPATLPSKSNCWLQTARFSRLYD